jgi:hypothetical protein
MDIASYSVADVAALLASGRAHEELSAAAGVPVAALRGAPCAIHVTSVPCVLVAEDPSLAPLVDVVGDADELTAVAATARRAPAAAVALALLLRGGGARTIESGLVAESTTYSMLQGGPEFAAWRRRRPARRPPEPGTAVRVERTGPTLTVSLARPHVHNAFNRAMRDGLADALSLATSDDTVERIVVRGDGPSFCSGGDLDEFGTYPDPPTAHVVRLSRSPARLLAGLAARVEVQLHGACMGAGIELPAFAARVVAAPDTTIALPEVGLGLVPGAGGTVSLPRRVGRHRTALLALSGTRIDAAIALRWGLVDALAG